MSMVCDMPEWKSNDLWIETTPPHLPQETSLVWEKQARFYNDFQVGQTFFILASLYMQVEGLNVKVKLTAHGPSLIVLKLTAPRGAIFVSPPGGNIDILLQFYNLSIL